MNKNTIGNAVMGVALLLALSSLGGLGYFLRDKFTVTSPSPTPSPSISVSPSNPSVTPSPTPTSSPLESPETLAKSRISRGERILIRREEKDNISNPDFLNFKQQGTKYFENKDYAKAAINFKNALDKYHNAPETRIYYNNAMIEGKKAYSIAVVVRSSEDPEKSLTILRGVAQAQEEINAQGGINSTPLKIVIVNDDNNPNIAKVMAKIIAETTDVLGVVGHYSSDCTIAAGKVYDEFKLVSISATSTADEISNLSPYVFRTVPSDLAAGKTLTEYIIKKKWRIAAAIFDGESDYSKSLKNAFVNNAKDSQINIVAEIDISQPGIKYNSEIQKLSSQVQVLMLALPDVRSTEVPLIGAANQGKMHLIGGDGLYNKKVLQSPGASSLVGMVLAVPWTIDNNRNTPFVQKSQELWKADVQWRTVMSYDATQALAEAIKANSQPTRETVKDALSNPNFSANGASQKITFRRNDRDSDSGLVRIEKTAKSRSGTGYDFVRIEE
jgi:branched-chain amino acid transport system substrate-binding protein